MDEIRHFEGGPLLTHSYLAPTPGGHWLMIDAPAEADAWIDALGITPVALLLTHQHFDHVASAAAIAARGVPIHAWCAYDPGLTLAEVVRQWGMPFDLAAFEVDHPLADQTTLEIDGLHLDIASVPGHSPDSVVFHDPTAGVLFAGDTLFHGSTGRPDLPGGDMAQLCHAIQQEIYSLPDSTRVLPGHGPETTVGHEAASNPIVRRP